MPVSGTVNAYTELRLCAYADLRMVWHEDPMAESGIIVRPSLPICYNPANGGGQTGCTFGTRKPLRHACVAPSGACAAQNSPIIKRSDT
jgi:hypothetical protein